MSDILDAVIAEKAAEIAEARVDAAEERAEHVVDAAMDTVNHIKQQSMEERFHTWTASHEQIIHSLQTTILAQNQMLATQTELLGKLIAYFEAAMSEVEATEFSSIPAPLEEAPPPMIPPQPNEKSAEEKPEPSPKRKGPRLI